MPARSIISSTASFTRPADTTAYTIGDLMANSVTAGSVVPLTFVFSTGAGNGIWIRSCKIVKSNSTATNGNFHLRLYAASPTCANGDNGAWSTTVSGYLGKVDPVIVEAFTDGCAVVDSLSESADLLFNLGQANLIYGLLVADAAYTPASAEVFTVTLIGEAC